MNKILIVGHPQSGYEEVESLLSACGMGSAQPSRREGFLPTEISDTLCKAHGASPNHRLGSPDEIQQIEAGAVWHGMALDLMLGNLDQEFWGWADPQAVRLLNYWRDLDPKITFVLLYDRPHSALTQAKADEAVSLSADSLSHRIRSWTAYNAALLHFFHRNPQRCLLVNSQQVRQSASSYLQQLRARIDAPWSERMEQLAMPDAPPAPGVCSAMDIDASETTEPGVSHNKNLAPAYPAGQRMDNLAPLLEPAPAEGALMAYLADALLQQHPASLELYEELQAVANLPLADDLAVECSPLDAWVDMATQQRRLNEQDRLAGAQQEEIDELGHRLQQSAALADQKQQQIERLAEAQGRAEQLAQERQNMLDEQTRLLETQTTAAQQRLAELQHAQQALQQAQQESEQENELLLSQLHQVQEELERYYLESQQQAQQLQALQEADKLAGERQQQIEQLRQQLSAETKRAAESTATVDTALQQENELLLTQLHQVQEELERYYLENQRLKTAPARAPEPALYGAGDRIRQQLSYKLGATMIQRSRSLAGWASMPWALLREVHRHRRDRPRRLARKLPPIHRYRDAHEAERHRNHLSYRLGQAMLANARTPFGWVRMPWALHREVREFRRRQRR